MILFLKIFQQINLVSILIIVSVLDYIKIHKSKKIYKRTRFSLFASIILSLILSLFFVIYDEQSKQQEVSELNQQITILKQKGDFATNSITGGDSYCYYSLTNFGTDSAIASVLSEGNYPLYDVVIRMADVEDLVELSKKPTTIEERWSKDKVLNLGNVSANGALLLGTVKLPHPDNVRYSISITARNGMFNEEIRLKKVNGIWKSAMKVVRIEISEADANAPDTLLKEEVDLSFPRNKDGQVDWE